MFCCFCKQSTHLAEYCRDFPNLRSRYSEIFKRNQSSCLCLKYKAISKEDSRCKCKIICEACFQHHHIAMCPKRDIDHPSNSLIFPESLCLFSHPSHFARRFLELCNPMDQFKLHSCCKYFKNLQPIKLKLNPSFKCNSSIPSANVVFNKYGSFINAGTVKTLSLERPCQFNFDSILLDNYTITLADLKMFAKSDPNTICIKYCKFDDLLTLHDILEAFPYAYDITYLAWSIPETWVLNFLCAERKVEFRKITINDRFLDFNINDMIMLLEQNENLTVIVFADIVLTSTKVKQLETHPQFIPCSSTVPHNICVVLNANGSKTCFRFIRF